MSGEKAASSGRHASKKREGNKKERAMVGRSRHLRKGAQTVNEVPKTPLNGSKGSKSPSKKSGSATPAASKVKKMQKGSATIALDNRIILRKLKKARQHYRGIAGEEDADARWGGEKDLKRGTAVALAHLELIEAWLVYNVTSKAGEKYIPVYGKRKLADEEKRARRAAAVEANVYFDKNPSADGVDSPAVKAIIMAMATFRSPSTPAEKYSALLSDAPLHEKAERMLEMRQALAQPPKCARRPTNPRYRSAEVKASLMQTS